MIRCKSCASIGKYYEMKPVCWNKNQQIYQLTCQNPNHVYSVWRQLSKGWWYPVELSKVQESRWTSSGIEYRTGGRTKKISEAHLKDIRSRTVHADGSVTRDKNKESAAPLTWEE